MNTMDLTNLNFDSTNKTYRIPVTIGERLCFGVENTTLVEYSQVFMKMENICHKFLKIF